MVGVGVETGVGAGVTVGVGVGVGVGARVGAEAEVEVGVTRAEELPELLPGKRVDDVDGVLGAEVEVGRTEKEGDFWLI